MTSVQWIGRRNDAITVTPAASASAKPEVSASGATMASHDRGGDGVERRVDARIQAVEARQHQMAGDPGPVGGEAEAGDQHDRRKLVRHAGALRQPVRAAAAAIPAAAPPAICQGGPALK